jgi:hypothetical protein
VSVGPSGWPRDRASGCSAPATGSARCQLDVLLRLATLRRRAGAAPPLQRSRSRRFIAATSARLISATIACEIRAASAASPTAPPIRSATAMDQSTPARERRLNVPPECRDWRAPECQSRYLFFEARRPLVAPRFASSVPSPALP